MQHPSKLPSDRLQSVLHAHHGAHPISLARAAWSSRAVTRKNRHSEEGILQDNVTSVLADMAQAQEGGQKSYGSLLECVPTLMTLLIRAVPHDLTSVQWRSVEWITAFGNLHPGNVLDYFAQSPFYDPTSNNAVLRMQTQFSVQAGQGFDEQQELKRFVGTEFAVTHSEPPDLFIIEKRDRKSPYEAHPIATYYVLHNSIYQSPDLYSVLSNRLLSSLYYMRTTLASAREKKTDFHPRTGGNRYRVIKEDQAQNAMEDKAVTAGKDGEDTQVIAAGLNVMTTKSEKKANSLEFLLARALQTTSVQTASKPP